MKGKNTQTPPQEKSTTALREEAVLQEWRENNIFEKSVQKDAPQGEFVFYDGPPFATGLPHMGHLLISSYKDVVGRYKTMRGYHVPRKWGWDCHGLPVENLVEKKLGLKTKKDIEAMGIDVFNEEARKNVLTYVHDWKQYVERVGRWVDFDNSYKTMDNTYIESVWWALSELHKKNKLYEGRKVLMYCPRCETPLSKAEIAMDNSYKDVTDEAVFVKFPLVGLEKNGIPAGAHILAWTTTPWTLPANMALAVGADISYVAVKKEDDVLVLAKERLEVLGDGWEVQKEFAGKDLVGAVYSPLYAAAQKNERTHTILAADFVTTQDGSGVVHIAPVYGEDDYTLGKENALPMVPLLDASGNFNNDAPEFLHGMYFKKGGKYVVQDLENRELLFKKHSHTHSYPHCYRCGTALIYNALTSWFIDIQSVKKELLAANEAVSWHPAHLKEGRFKHILETAPDWTISRNRFWASPLPIWKHEHTGEVHVFGSLRELRAHTKTSGNTYHFIRHGEAESNVQEIVSSLPENPHHLTEHGKEQVRHAVEKLRTMGITKIVTSPLVRTKETAGIVAEMLGLAKEDVLEDERLKEWQLRDFNNMPLSELRAAYPATMLERFTKRCGTGETLQEMKQRVGEALYSLEKEYANETILVVGHEYTGWFLECVARGYTVEECVAEKGAAPDYVANAEIRTIDFVPLSHNAQYEIDLHRPYIDTLEVMAKDGARLVRIPEVVDCWVESGSMPFASEHYPHENKALVERRYPGDFIAEYIAQTRTWFYYMHALGVLLFGTSSFKNSVVTGTILASDGSKMSKSKGNYTDPLLNIDRYGADALRFYLLGSVVMQAEDVAFKDEELREAHNRYINMLWNTFQFYNMQDTASVDREAYAHSTNVLDVWVLARLSGTVQAVTELMDTYDTVRAARLLRDFVTDFSTWYVRRSRDRLKGEDAEDKAVALSTLRYVLETFTRLTAPITPFIAESIYKGVGGSGESVHLAEWPEAGGWGPAQNKEVLSRMMNTQQVASEALNLRTKAGIKVRQVLATLTVPNIADVYPGLIAEEVNVQNVIEGDTLTLDTNLTEELLAEGDVRELVRAVQGLRKEMGLAPEENVALSIGAQHVVLTKALPQLKRVAGISAVHEDASEQHATTVHFHDDSELHFSLVRSEA